MGGPRVQGEAPERIAREPTRRLFFAFWPDGPMREALAHATHKAVRGSGGRPVAPENLHVTVAFLGSVPEGRIAGLARLARAAACAAPIEDGRLEMRLDQLAYWPRPRVLCAVPAQPSAPAAALAGALLDQLAAGDFAPDLKPFRPHVTVARKVMHPSRSLRMPSVVWPFTDFALIESRTLESGPVYSVVETYALFNSRNAAK